MGGLFIGLTVTLDIFMGGPISGAGDQPGTPFRPGTVGWGAGQYLALLGRTGHRWNFSGTSLQPRFRTTLNFGLNRKGVTHDSHGTQQYYNNERQSADFAGADIAVGQKAPDATVVANDLSEVRLLIHR